MSKVKTNLQLIPQVFPECKFKNILIDTYKYESSSNLFSRLPWKRYIFILHLIQKYAFILILIILLYYLLDFYVTF